MCISLYSSRVVLTTLGVQDFGIYNVVGGFVAMFSLVTGSLSNAITRASQDVESYDRATALEGIGWQVATMEPARWKEMNRD